MRAAASQSLLPSSTTCLGNSFVVGRGLVGEVVLPDMVLQPDSSAETVGPTPTSEYSGGGACLQCPATTPEAGVPTHYRQLQRCSFQTCSVCLESRRIIRQCSDHNAVAASTGGFRAPTASKRCSTCGLGDEQELNNQCPGCARTISSTLTSGQAPATIGCGGLVADPLSSQAELYPWVLLNYHRHSLTKLSTNKFSFSPCRNSEGFPVSPEISIVGNRFARITGDSYDHLTQPVGLILRFTLEEKFIGLSRTNLRWDMQSGGGSVTPSDSMQDLFKACKPLNFHTPPGVVLRDGDRYLLRGQGPPKPSYPYDGSDVTIFLAEADPSEQQKGVDDQWVMDDGRGGGMPGLSKVESWSRQNKKSLNEVSKKDMHAEVAARLRAIASTLLQEGSEAPSQQQGTTEANGNLVVPGNGRIAAFGSNSVLLVKYQRSRAPALPTVVRPPPTRY